MILAGLLAVIDLQTVGNTKKTIAATVHYTNIKPCFKNKKKCYEMNLQEVLSEELAC